MLHAIHFIPDDCRTVLVNRSQKQLAKFSQLAVTKVASQLTVAFCKNCDHAVKHTGFGPDARQAVIITLVHEYIIPRKDRREFLIHFKDTTNKAGDGICPYQVDTSE